MLAKNSIEGKAEPFLKRIETLLNDLDSLRGKHMAKCKAVREDIKEICVEAKDKDIPTKALKGLVKHRQLTKKQRAIAEGLDIDEAAVFEALIEGLGELGMAAAKRAGHVTQEA